MEPSLGSLSSPTEDWFGLRTRLDSFWSLSSPNIHWLLFVSGLCVSPAMCVCVSEQAGDMPEAIPTLPGTLLFTLGSLTLGGGAENPLGSQSRTLGVGRHSAAVAV